MDLTYILVIIGIVITLAASARLKGTYAKYSKVHTQCGLNGHDAAVKILEANGIYDVRVNVIDGELTDHYDPARKEVSLSHDIYSGTSIASVSVAAHECGHAIQDSLEYSPLRFRTALVPVANIGTKLAWPMILIGVILGTLMRSDYIGPGFMTVGIFAFSLGVLFQIVTLPVEYNASDRAIQQLRELGILTSDEDAKAQKVLKAAALTYVAAAAAGLLQLLRLILILRGGRNRS